MTLVVESGVGLPNAESYVSVSDADVYVSAYVFSPSAWSGLSTQDKENALRQGTAYLDNKYRTRWIGVRFFDNQALAWPRAAAVDEDGFTYGQNEIPTTLKRATVEAAVRAASGELQPDLASPGVVTRTRKKVGPLETETEYGLGGNSPAPSYSKIQELVKALITSGSVAERG